MTTRGALVFYSPIDRYDLWTDHIKRHLPDLPVRIYPDTVGAREDIAYALVWNPPPGELKSFPNLKCVFSLGAGVDHVLNDPDFPRHVPLVRVVDPSLTAGMTEYVVMHTLIIHRRQRDFDALQRAKKWRQAVAPPARDGRVGIMGLGVLGLDAARHLRAFGYQIAAWSRARKFEDGIESFAGPGELRSFLKLTDILVCLLPLTRDTRGIINRETLAMLRPGAALINAARGAHVVTGDLIAALDSGHLKWATLDVFEREPLPEDSPLWTHPKVTVTPHIASITDPRFVAETVARNIERMEKGLPPQNVVDLARGY